MLDPQICQRHFTIMAKEAVAIYLATHAHLRVPRLSWSSGCFMTRPSTVSACSRQPASSKVSNPSSRRANLRYCVSTFRDTWGVSHAEDEGGPDGLLAVMRSICLVDHTGMLQAFSDSSETFDEKLEGTVAYVTQSAEEKHETYTLQGGG